MSLVTLEVEIDHGRIISRGSEPLPEKASGLLTLLPNPTADDSTSRRTAVREFLEKWTGAFTLPEGPTDDPRLARLIAKHVK